jgi:phosphate starvation-inducible PhoH-like protein
LNELTLSLDNINPGEFWGLDNELLNVLKKAFPKLRLVARGNELKAIGDEEMLDLLQKKMAKAIDHFEKYHQLKEDDLKSILGSVTADNEPKHVHVSSTGNDSEPLVFGPNGIVVKARTQNQKRMVISSTKNDIIFAIGPAGTGKTYTAVALAVKALKNKEVKRIILTRPAVEAGENLGFLPGDLKEKIDPYLRPLYDASRLHH